MLTVGDPGAAGLWLGVGFYACKAWKRTWKPPWWPIIQSIWSKDSHKPGVFWQQFSEKNIWHSTSPASVQRFLYKRWHKLPRGRTNPDLFYGNKGFKLKCSHWVSKAHKYATLGQQHLLRSVPCKHTSHPTSSILWSVFRSEVTSLSVPGIPELTEKHNPLNYHQLFSSYWATALI